MFTCVSRSCSPARVFGVTAMWESCARIVVISEIELRVEHARKERTPTILFVVHEPRQDGGRNPPNARWNVRNTVSKNKTQVLNHDTYENKMF